MYKDYTHHLVLATFLLFDELKEKALEQGVTILQRKGDVIESFVPAYGDPLYKSGWCPMCQDEIKGLG